MSARTTNRHRYSRRNPCPVCGGGHDDPAGEGVRCWGNEDATGEYARCTRVEHAGPISQNSDNTYTHWLGGPCDCGVDHREEQPKRRRVRRVHHASPGGTIGITLQQLAEAKGLPAEFLRELGCHDDMHRGLPAVAIPYRDEDGEIKFERKRLTLDPHGQRFHQPAGVGIGTGFIPYGLWLLPQIKKAGRVLFVEGESDCWTAWYHGMWPVQGIPGKGIWDPTWTAYYEDVPYKCAWLEPRAEKFIQNLSESFSDLRVIEGGW